MIRQINGDLARQSEVAHRRGVTGAIAIFPEGDTRKYLLPGSRLLAAGSKSAFVSVRS